MTLPPLFFQCVGTDGANLSFFFTVNNLVKFRNTKKCLQIPEDHALGPNKFYGCNLSNFTLFVLGYTRFLKIILGYGGKL